MSLGLGDIDKAAINATAQKITDAIASGETQALDALHAELAGLYQAESGIVSQIDTVLGARLAQLDQIIATRVSEALESAEKRIRGLLDGATVTNSIKL